MTSDLVEFTAASWWWLTLMDCCMDEWRDYAADQDTAEPSAACERLLVRDTVWSPQLHNERQILVHLPAGYAAGDQRYPVIYMQDGQNLFDPATSYAGDWQAGAALDALEREGLAAILVGIPNMGKRRLAEYSPFRDLRYGGGAGDAYLDFVASTLKPLIDGDFRTLPDREHTAIAGSSMGGLISLYALFARPDVFGLAGVLSPSLWFARGAIFRYLRRQPLVPGRLWLDAGDQEGGNTLRNTRRLRDLLTAKGYHPGVNLHYLEATGAGHNEAAWAARLPDMLRFLLAGAAGTTAQPAFAPAAD
jgi:predicted alpha/beta superfamily hydrolase